MLEDMHMLSALEAILRGELPELALRATFDPASGTLLLRSVAGSSGAAPLELRKLLGGDTVRHVHWDHSDWMGRLSLPDARLLTFRWGGVHRFLSFTVLAWYHPRELTDCLLDVLDSGYSRARRSTTR
jgi:hypothetical protein